MNKNGFTLMEVLAVMLTIAVIATFLLPAIRSVRAEVYYHQAKGAGAKMAEAMKSFYRDSKGYIVTGSFTGTSLSSASYTCDANSPVRTGIPPSIGDHSVGVGQLFGCGYLNVREFLDLPYTVTSSVTSANRSTLVTVTASDARAGRYYDGSNTVAAFTVSHDMAVVENEQGN